MKTVQQRFFERFDKIAATLEISLLISMAFSNAGEIFKEGTNKGITFQFNLESATFTFHAGKVVQSFPCLFYADPMGVDQFFRALEKFLA